MFQHLRQRFQHTSRTVEKARNYREHYRSGDWCFPQHMDEHGAYFEAYDKVFASKVRCYFETPQSACPEGIVWAVPEADGYEEGAAVLLSTLDPLPLTF